MTRVAIVAGAAAVRGRLEKLLAPLETLTVAAVATSADALAADPALASVDAVLLHATEAIGPRDLETMPPIPVIVLTGHRVPPSALSWSFAAGVRGILSDDASGDEIVAAVDAAVAGLVVVAPELLTDPVGDGARDVAAARRQQSAIAMPPLTPREREILSMLAEGLPNKVIAARLAISEHTVKTHLEAIFDKLGASTRAEAVALGVRRGLLLL